tara:strand:- start:417 stop:731 length:315 start_codon:yes stop_codon:yes gene_type:complete
MKGRNPNKKEKDHMDTVQQLGCIVCRNEYGVFSPAEIHHVYGKTKKNAHLYVLPLCFRHHREGIDCELFSSRHPFKRQFEERYGKEEDLLEQVQELLGLELMTL